MTLPFVLSAKAESACQLVNRAVGLHRLQALEFPESSVRSRLLPHSDALQAQRQATVLRLVSLVESFCADQLLELAESDIQPEENQLRRLIWERASTTAVSTWSSMSEAYASWLGLKINWVPIGRWVEIRNAIAHGQGRLTRMQLKKRQPTVTKITQARVAIEHDTIVLTEDNVTSARNVCLELIYQVDEVIQKSREVP